MTRHVRAMITAMLVLCASCAEAGDTGGNNEAGVAAGEASPSAPLEPPVGYVSLVQTFPDDIYGTDGLRDIQFGFRIGSVDDSADTFWSNQVSFANSGATLPANVPPDDVGGYIGLQLHAEQDPIAIVSIWWALETRPGPGAECVSDIEAWYDDDRPFDPAIESMDETDPDRPVAGGPFLSCRLPIDLAEGVDYGLRLQAEAGGWWSAWLTHENANPMLIGRIRVPAGWGGINQADGFIEYFGPVPDGCDSIPSSQSVVLPATANSGTSVAQLSAHLYGACEQPLTARTRITPAGGGRLSIVVD